jgi:hypothetical protein
VTPGYGAVRRDPPGHVTVHGGESSAHEVERKVGEIVFHTVVVQYKPGQQQHPPDYHGDGDGGAVVIKDGEGW